MSNEPKKGWSEWLPVHPAAELFPLMSREELRELADDIKQGGGLISLVMLIKDEHGRESVLDGRNRLNALELLGETITRESPIFRTLAAGVDPYGYVVSMNLRRRHLNDQDRQKVVIEFIARSPQKSDRQMAKEIGVDHKTIARARTKGEDVGRIPHVENRTDTKGRKQPAHKLLSKAEVQAPADRAVARAPIIGNDVDPQASSDMRKAEATTAERRSLAIAAVFNLTEVLGRLGTIKQPVLDDAKSAEWVGLVAQCRKLLFRLRALAGDAEIRAGGQADHAA